MAAPLIFQPLVKYAVFNGRSRRSEFWLFVLSQYVLFGILGYIVFLFMPPLPIAAKTTPEAMMSWMMHLFQGMSILNIVQLGLLLPNLAVTVRRLHDSNRSGWWMLMPYGVMFASFILIGISIAVMAATQGHQQPQNPAAAIIAIVLLYLLMLGGFVTLLIFLVLDGTPGPNRFGPDPKGRGNIDVF